MIEKHNVSLQHGSFLRNIFKDYFVMILYDMLNGEPNLAWVTLLETKHDSSFVEKGQFRT